MRKTVRTMAWALGVGVAAAAWLGCGPDRASPQKVGLANPASVHCGKEGGELRIESLGNGAQYGVCIFEDNRQCEEWALFRGACPKGGLRVTGYVTPGGRYCAILGGTYRMTHEATSSEPERGECRLPGGATCRADALYAGDCPGHPG